MYFSYQYFEDFVKKEVYFFLIQTIFIRHQKIKKNQLQQYLRHVETEVEKYYDV